MCSRESFPERLQWLANKSKAGGNQFLEWLNAPTTRGVLKCTLAYTLASLATFWTPLSEFLGKPDGKHVVATITVYFHPARSTGSMIEAILIAIVAVAYAETISILSMCTSVLVGGVWDAVALAHTLVILVFIGGGFGFIGWVKQTMNNPLVNVGSTLASLAIIGVVTKETAVLSNVFSNQKIVQIFKMLFMGVTATTTVNLLIWRVSAVGLLRKSMTKASTSLGDMLAIITHGFLSGAEGELQSPEFSAASASYLSAYPQLTKNLREAKFERYLMGHEKLYKLERTVVRSVETLAQSLGALRSAANTQFALLQEAMEPGSGVFSSPEASPTVQRTLSSVLKSGRERFLSLSAIDEASEESYEDGANRFLTGSPDQLHGSAATQRAQSSFRHPSEIFELFISLLGPSMKSLAYTLSEILRDPPFGSPPDYDIIINDQFRHSLSDALGLFNTARANALEELYRHLEFGRARSERIQADFEEVAAACGHFSFSLQAFGEEMQKYLDVLDDLKFASQHKNRSWQWIKWWRKHPNNDRRRSSAVPLDPEEQETLIRPIKKTAMPAGIADAIIRQKDTYNWRTASEANKVVMTLSQRLLRFLRKIGKDEGEFPQVFSASRKSRQLLT